MSQQQRPTAPAAGFTLSQNCLSQLPARQSLTLAGRGCRHYPVLHRQSVNVKSSHCISSVLNMKHLLLTSSTEHKGHPFSGVIDRLGIISWSAASYCSTRGHHCPFPGTASEYTAKHFSMTHKKKHCHFQWSNKVWGIQGLPPKPAFLSQVLSHPAVIGKHN